MVQLEKERIVAELQRQKPLRGGSQNKLAKFCGISEAYMSLIMNGKWETISDGMWRGIRSALGMSAKLWETAETQQYKVMWEKLSFAQSKAQVLAIVGCAGSGKTHSIEEYCRHNKDAYNISCADYLTPRTFLKLLCKTIGINSSGSIYEMVESIISEMKHKPNPLLILDEADKLNNKTLYFFISFYNRLKKRCGMVLCATEYLSYRIRRGAENKSKGLEEIYSRIGKNFTTLPQVNDEDIALVCTSNGIDDDKMIRLITEDSQQDLRRVERILSVMEDKMG